jgi:opacity protein-like surface antigen
MTTNKLTTHTLLALAALLATAGIACAQGAASPGGNFGGHVGWVKAKDANDGNFLGGIHAELRLIPWLGVQGSVDYWLADTIDLPGDEELKVRSIPVTVTGRLYIVGTDQLSVFAAAGAGWYHIMYDFPAAVEDLGIEDKNDNTFGWHVGAGLVVPVTPTLAVYAEGRAIFLDPDQAINDDDLEDVKDFDYDSAYLAAGVNFMF